MLSHPLGSIAYTVLNAFGSAAALVFAIVAVLRAWRRRRREPSAFPRDDLFSRNLFYQLKKEVRRRRFHPVFFLVCYAAAYLVLMQGIKLAGLLFNVTKVADRVRLFPGGVSYASGVLLFIPVFLLLARLFPGNGRPTEQLELVMPALALSHVFNRLACLMGGCCFGVPSPLGVVYPDTAAASTLYGAGTRVFPNQPIESGIMLLLFVLLLVLRARGRRTLPIFPLVFGAAGFFLGFVMDHSYEPLKPILGFTYPTPFTHLLVFFVGVLFLVLVLREKRKSGAPAPQAGDVPA